MTELTARRKFRRSDDLRPQEPIPRTHYAAIVIFSLALLAYRLHAQHLERRFMTMRSETAASERLARTFLAVRDFTNTPLQTIQLANEVIRKREPTLAPVVDRIDRSVDRLFRLNQTFAAYEGHLKWTPADVSPDAETLTARDDWRH